MENTQHITSHEVQYSTVCFKLDAVIRLNLEISNKTLFWRNFFGVLREEILQKGIVARKDLMWIKGREQNLLLFCAVKTAIEKQTWDLLMWHLSTVFLVLAVAIYQLL